MLQVLVLPLLTAIHLAVAPIATPQRLVVGPQLQSASIFSEQILQPSINANQLQGSVPIIQASGTSAAQLQPAIGEGVNGWSLQ